MISIYVEFANGDRKTFRGVVEKALKDMRKEDEGK